MPLYGQAEAQKKKTILIVLSMIAFMFASCELLFAVRHTFQLVIPIQAVFEPIEDFFLFK